MFSAKILKKMTQPGLTFGEHYVKFSTLEIIFCVFMAEISVDFEII
jgi:hypothetical protein